MAVVAVGVGWGVSVGNGVRVAVLERVGVTSMIDSVETSGVLFSNESDVCKVAVAERTAALSGGRVPLPNSSIHTATGIVTQIPKSVMATAPSTMSYKRLTGRWERNDSTFAFAACIALRGGG